MHSRTKHLQEVPVTHHLSTVVEWTRKTHIAPAQLETYLAWTLFLPEVSEESMTVEEFREHFNSAEISYLGGPSLLVNNEEWPRNTNGMPLAHVMTLDLGDLAENGQVDEVRESFPGATRLLPQAGTLEVFHDLETYGWEREDRTLQGWKLIHTDTPQHTLPTHYGPEDLDLPHAAYGQLFHGDSTIMLPSSLDVDGSTPGSFEAAELAMELYLNALHMQYSSKYPNDSPPGFTHVYGRSLGGNNAIMPLIQDALPLASSADRHILLIEIDTSGALSGWFGDHHPLEIWIRASDLEERDFDQAWCIIRSDC